MDINPVAACVTGAKAHVPTLPAIESRLDELERHCRETDWLAVAEERRALPLFFAHAFHYIPPYLDVTHFEEDQWLRLWFLGGPP